MIYLYLHFINLKYSIFFLFSRFIMQITIVRGENLKSHPCGYKIFPYVYGFTSLTTMINKGYTRLIFFPSNKDFTYYQYTVFERPFRNLSTDYLITIRMNRSVRIRWKVVIFFSSLLTSVFFLYYIICAT